MLGIALGQRRGTLISQYINAAILIHPVFACLMPSALWQGEHPGHNSRGDFGPHQGLAELVKDAHHVPVPYAPFLRIQGIHPDHLGRSLNKPGVVAKG